MVRGESIDKESTIRMSTAEGEFRFRLIVDDEVDERFLASIERDFYRGSFLFQSEATYIQGGSKAFKYISEIDELTSTNNEEDIFRDAGPPTFACGERGQVFFLPSNRHIRICMRTSSSNERREWNGDEQILVGFVAAEDGLSWETLDAIRSKTTVRSPNEEHFLARPIRIIDVWRRREHRVDSYTYRREFHPVLRIPCCPSVRDIGVKYFGSGTPVILDGLAERYGWRATKRWTPAILATEYGDETVSWRNPKHPAAKKHLNGRVDGYDMRTFLREMKGDSRNYAVGMINLFARPQFRHLLRDDIVYEPYFVPVHDDDGLWNVTDVDTNPINPIVWIGSRDTRTVLHHDARNSIFVQIYGTKRFRIVPAEQRDLIYPSPDNRVYSQINIADDRQIEDIDIDRFPAFKRATVYEAVLEPGDALVLPAGVYHDVTCETETCVSLSMVNHVEPLQHILRLWMTVASANGAVLKYAPQIVMTEEQRTPAHVDDPSRDERIRICPTEGDLRASIAAHRSTCDGRDTCSSTVLRVEIVNAARDVVLVVSLDGAEDVFRPKIVMARSATTFVVPAKRHIVLRDYSTDQLLDFRAPSIGDENNDVASIKFEKCDRAAGYSPSAPKDVPLSVDLKRRRRFGRTGLDVSTMGLAVPRAWSDLVELEGVVVDQDEILPEATKRLRVAIANANVSVFDFTTRGACNDTAIHDRGHNTRRTRARRIRTIFGNALRLLSKEGEVRRENLVLSADVYLDDSDVGYALLSRKNILLKCQQARRDLGVDAIDLFVAAEDDASVPLEDVVHAFGTLLLRGHVHHWGVSGWTPERMRKLVTIAEALRVPIPSIYAVRYPANDATNRLSHIYEFLVEKRIGVILSTESDCLNVSSDELAKFDAMARDYELSASALLMSWIADSYVVSHVSKFSSAPNFVFLTTDANMTGNGVLSYATAMQRVIERRRLKLPLVHYFDLIPVPVECLRLLCGNDVVIGGSWGTASLEAQGAWKNRRCSNYLSETHMGMSCAQFGNGLRSILYPSH